MSKRIPLLIIIPVFILTLSSATVLAGTDKYFTYKLSADHANPENIIKLKVSANKTSTTAAGFRIIVSYDSSVLKFIGTETSSLIKSGTMHTNGSDDSVCSVYVCNTNKSSAPTLHGNIINYLFQIKSGVESGTTVLDIKTNQICDYDANQLNADYEKKLQLSISPLSSKKAYLTQLVPLAGKLYPDFSSNIHSYNMYVNYNTGSVEFQAAAGEDGSVKINRKTLYAAGKSTVITITVTSADKQNKTEYLVTVNRGNKPQSASAVKKGTASRGRSEKGTIANASSGSKYKTSGGKNAALKKQQLKNFSGVKKSSKSSKSNGGTVSAVNGADMSSYSRTDSDYNTAAQVRNIYITGNSMPAFVGGILITIVCIMCGILLNIWLRPQDKQNKKQ